MKDKRLYLLFALILVAVVSLHLNNKRYEKNQKQFLTTILNISKLPDSFQIENYSSYGITDTLETCVAHISPKDFESLISGREFIKKTVNGTFHDHYFEKKIGKAYKASELYVVDNPSDFKDGGSITLVVNPKKTEVGIDIYIE